MPVQISVRVLDHFIVGDGDPLSMAEYERMYPFLQS
jgi:DNA repair protein RadC